MRITRFLPRLALAALVASSASCSDSSGPAGGDTKDPAELTIVRLAATSPLLFNPVDSFYAKRGEDREVRIFFADIEGGAGEEYLRLRIDAQSLLARPDGTLFQEGDSIQQDESTPCEFSRHFSRPLAQLNVSAHLDHRRFGQFEEFPVVRLDPTSISFGDI